MFSALIVDDEEPVRIAIKKLLDAERFHIEKIYEAENGRDALEKMEEIQPDLIFADIRMPIMDGMTFLTKAVEIAPSAVCLIITGFDEFSYAQNAIRLGVSDYLLKPIKEEELNGSVETGLKRIYPTIDFSSSAADTPSADIAIQMIHDTIDSKFSEDISVTDFAAKFFFSKEYLNKLFKQKYKCSIYEYLLSVRMKEAARLLVNPDIKIADAAKHCGYADTNYFSKAVHNYYGKRPSEFRKSAEND